MVRKEIDATNLFTYAKGYGNYEDSDGWEVAKLNREYTSPLAQVLGIRHAPPIKDGRIKNNSTMDKQLKALVDESLKISVSANIHDLTKQGYPIAQAKKGDSTIEDTWQAGILVEEAPPELLFDGDSVDLYTYINYIAKAIQQLSNEVYLLKE